MKNMKITNVKTTVILKKPFTYTYYGVTSTISKGTVFNTNQFGHNGIVIVLGHGDAEVIPHDYLGKYIKTWNEVITDGKVTEIKKCKKDVTDEWLAYWKNLADKKVAAENRDNRIKTKQRIANLRKTIKYVKSGVAEKELNELLTLMKTL